ncbi:DUF58 domain-containing protein [Actinopolymorpha alba]|uniref:DUF58 domain-containing protein n=1 Tax=Actinopolymorpha alba TaxID=533267 RepID=UPI0003799CA8|nr:DUF58 domain-containing protein [Actinopolymorpha alba]
MTATSRGRRFFAPEREPHDDAWSPTAALPRAIVMVLVLLLGAVVTGRVDLAVLAAPFVLGAALALRSRPRRPPTVAMSTRQESLVEGDELYVDVVVHNSGEAAYDLALVRVGDAGVGIPPGLGDQGGWPAIAAPVRAAEQARVTLHGETRAWGWQTLPPARVRAVACGALLESRPATSEPLRVKVFPRDEPFEAGETMPNAAGLVGAHRSRMYGDGGELAGIRQYAPGDRLRRIDWRASLRTRELHVAHTLSDRDAELVLLLDVLHSVGVDRAARAAAGIARHYLGRGDRVRLLEYGGRNRALRVGSGTRHYLLALEWLLALTPGEGPHDPVEGILRRHLLPSSALLVVLTPLVDARSVAMVARFARTGRPVVAIDTLPESARPANTSPWSEVAYQMWRMERRTTIARLLEHGVPTVAWAGKGSLDHVLRDMARMAAAPR